MNKLLSYFAALSVTAWVGGLWAIGYLAVPILFHTQPDKQLAGMLAGRLFETLAYVGVVCAAYLLLYRWLTVRKRLLRDRDALIVVLMLSITLANLCYIQPLMVGLKTLALPLEVMQSALAPQFKMWHGISSVLYLIESLLGVWLVTRTVGIPNQ